MKGKRGRASSLRKRESSFLITNGHAIGSVEKKYEMRRGERGREKKKRKKKKKKLKKRTRLEI